MAKQIKILTEDEQIAQAKQLVIDDITRMSFDLNELQREYYMGDDIDVVNKSVAANERWLGQLEQVSQEQLDYLALMQDSIVNGMRGYASHLDKYSDEYQEIDQLITDIANHYHEVRAKLAKKLSATSSDPSKSAQDKFAKVQKERETIIKNLVNEINAMGSEILSPHVLGALLQKAHDVYPGMKFERYTTEITDAATKVANKIAQQGVRNLAARKYEKGEQTHIQQTSVVQAAAKAVDQINNALESSFKYVQGSRGIKAAPVSNINQIVGKPIIYDIETVGTLGGTNFSPTQLTMKESGKQAHTMIVGLTKGAKELWLQIVNKIEHPNTDPITGVEIAPELTPEERRMIIQMTQYGEDAIKRGKGVKHKISTTNKGWQDDVLIQKSAEVWKEALKGYSILEKAQSGEAHYENYAATLKEAVDALSQIMGFNVEDNTFIAHNAQTFDAQVMRQFKINLKHTLDTLPIARGLYADYSISNRGKNIKGNYTLSNLKEFLDLEVPTNGGGYHTAEYDVDVLDALFQKMREDIAAGVKRKDLSEPTLDKGAYIIAQKSWWRLGINDFVTSVNDNKLVDSNSPFADLYAAAGDIVQWLGMVTKEVNGEKKSYAKWQNVTHNKQFYIEADKASDMASFIAGIGGYSVDAAELKQAQQEASIKNLFGDNGSKFVNIIMNSVNPDKAVKIDDTGALYQKTFLDNLPRELKSAIVKMVEGDYGWKNLNADQQNFALKSLGASLGYTKFNPLNNYSLKNRVETGYGDNFIAIQQAYIDFLEQNKEFFTGEDIKGLTSKIMGQNPGDDPFGEVRSLIISSILTGEKYRANGALPYGFSDKMGLLNYQSDVDFLDKAKVAIETTRDYTANAGFINKNLAPDRNTALKQAVAQVKKFYENLTDQQKANLNGQHLINQIGRTGGKAGSLISLSFGEYNSNAVDKNPFGIGTAGYELTEMLADAIENGMTAIPRITGNTLEIGLYNAGMDELYSTKEGEIDWNRITKARVFLSDKHGNLLDASKVNTPSLQLKTIDTTEGKRQRDITVTSAVEELMETARHLFRNSDGKLGAAGRKTAEGNNFGATSTFSRLGRDVIDRASGMSTSAKYDEAVESSNIDYGSPLKNLVTSTALDIMDLTKTFQRMYGIFKDNKGNVLDEDKINETHSRELLALIHGVNNASGQGLKYVDYSKNQAYAFYQNTLEQQGQEFHDFIDRIANNIDIDLGGLRDSTYGRSIKTFSLGLLNTFGKFGSLSAILLDQLKEGLNLVNDNTSTTYGNYLGSRAADKAGVDMTQNRFRLRKYARVTDEDIFRGAYGYHVEDQTALDDNAKYLMQTDETIEDYKKRFAELPEDIKNIITEYVSKFTGGVLPSVEGGELLVRENMWTKDGLINIRKLLQSERKKMVKVNKLSAEFRSIYPDVAKAFDMAQNGDVKFFNNGKGIELNRDVRIGGNIVGKSGSVLTGFEKIGDEFFLFTKELVEAFDGVAGVGTTSGKGPLHFISDEFAGRIAESAGIDYDTQMFELQLGYKSKYLPDMFQSRLNYILSIARDENGLGVKQIDDAFKSLGKDSILAKLVKRTPGSKLYKDTFRYNEQTGQLQYFTGNIKEIENPDFENKWQDLAISAEELAKLFSDTGEFAQLADILGVKYNPNMGMQALTLRDAYSDWNRRAIGGADVDDYGELEKGFMADTKFRTSFHRVSTSYGADELYTKATEELLNLNTRERSEAQAKRQAIIDARERNATISPRAASGEHLIVNLIANDISDQVLEQLNIKGKGNIQFRRLKDIGITSTAGMPRDSSGRITSEEQYGQLASTQIAKMIESGMEVVVTSDTSLDNLLGTKAHRVVMPRFAPKDRILGAEDNIINTFIQTAKDTTKVNNQENAKGFYQALDDLAFSNSGSIKIGADKTKLTHSAMPTLNAINQHEVDMMADKFRNTIVMPAEQFKEMAKNKLGLAGEVSYDKVESLNQLVEAVKGTKIEDYKSVEETADLVKVLDQLIDALALALDISNENAEYLGGLSARYPYITGRDSVITRIRTNKNAAPGQIQVTQDWLARVNGDTDTDFGELWSPSLGLNFGKGEEGYAQMLKYREEEAQKLGKSDLEGYLLSLKYKQDKAEAPKDSSEKMASHINNNVIDKIIGQISKYNFQSVGRFSNISTSVRDALMLAGLDESNTQLGTEGGVQAMLLRNYFRIFELDAISSKKVEERLNEVMKNENLDIDAAQDRVVELILGELNDIYAGLTSGVTEKVIAAFGKAETLGLEGSSQVKASTIGQIGGTYGRQGLEEAFKILGIDTSGYDFDAIGKALENNDFENVPKEIEEALGSLIGDFKFTFQGINTIAGNLNQSGFDLGSEMRKGAVRAASEHSSRLMANYLERVKAFNNLSKTQLKLAILSQGNNYIPAAEVRNAADYLQTHNREVFMEESGAKEEKSISVTALAKDFTQRNSESNLPSVAGTYAHGIVELLYKAGVDTIAEFNATASKELKDEYNKLVEEYNKGSEKFAEDDNLSRETMERRAEYINRINQETGLYNDTTKTEVTMGGKFAFGTGGAITGQADIITEKDDSVVVGDYKFSQVNTPETLAERIYQANAYLFMQESEIIQEKAKKLQQLQSIDKNNTEEYSKVLSEIDQLDKQLEKYVNGEVQINRNFFDKHDQKYKTEVVKSKRVDRDTMENILKHLQISDRGLAATRFAVGDEEMSMLDYFKLPVTDKSTWFHGREASTPPIIPDQTPVSGNQQPPLYAPPSGRAVFDPNKDKFSAGYNKIPFALTDETGAIRSADEVLNGLLTEGVNGGNVANDAVREKASVAQYLALLGEEEKALTKHIMFLEQLKVIEDHGGDSNPLLKQIKERIEAENQENKTLLESIRLRKLAYDIEEKYRKGTGLSDESRDKLDDAFATHAINIAAALGTALSQAATTVNNAIDKLAQDIPTGLEKSLKQQYSIQHKIDQELEKQKTASGDELLNIENRLKILNDQLKVTKDLTKELAKQYNIYLIFLENQDQLNKDKGTETSYASDFKKKIQDIFDSTRSDYDLGKVGATDLSFDQYTTFYAQRLEALKNIEELEKKRANITPDANDNYTKQLLIDLEAINSALEQLKKLLEELNRITAEYEGAKPLTTNQRKVIDGINKAATPADDDLVNRYFTMQKAINTSRLDATMMKSNPELYKIMLGRTSALEAMSPQLTYEAGKNGELGKYYLSDENGNKRLVEGEQLNSLLKQRNELAQQYALEEKNVQTALKPQVSLLSQITSSIKQRVKWMTTMSLGYKIINKFTSAIKSVITTTSQLDQKLVNLQIAIGGTREETHELLKEYSSIAGELGKTTQEVADAANSWYRSGYRGKEAIELTKASMQLSTLGAIQSADATKYLVSALKGWKLQASEVSEVVDRLVTIDMNAAISAGDLAEAMSRANNSARLAGVSMDTYIGYLTTVVDTTQKSAESVGQSFQTIFSRFSNVKAGKYAATADDMNSENYSEDNFTALNDIETVLTKVGIKVRENAKDWRSVEDIMDEIASKWKGWDQTTQNAVATAIAGNSLLEHIVIYGVAV